MTSPRRMERLGVYGGDDSEGNRSCHICGTLERDVGCLSTCASCERPFCDDYECQHNIDSTYCSECTLSRGLAETYFRFGALWHEGKHQPVDYGRAIDWYRRAVKFDSIPAHTNLGVLLLDRWNRAPADVEEAVRLLRTAAHSDDKKAAWNYALCLDQGIGTGRDSIQAARWYHLAALKGDEHAAYNLGDSLAADGGEEILEALSDLDLRSPEEWYEMAAKNDCPYAQMRLATNTDGLGASYRPIGDPMIDSDYRHEQIRYEWSNRWEEIAASGHPAAYCVAADSEDADDSRRAFFLLHAAARGFEPGLDTFRGYWTCLPMDSGNADFVTNTRIAAEHVHGRGPYGNFTSEEVHSLPFRYTALKCWELLEIEPLDGPLAELGTLDEWFGWA